MKKYTELTEEIREAICQCQNRETAEKLADFLERKNEKYTYDADEKRYFINSFYPSFPGKAWDRMVNALFNIADRGKRIPLQADLVVTGKCHCHCWHCFRAKYDASEMSINCIKSCIESLKSLGTATVGITGGEPMLREDIMEIINAIPEEMEGQLYTTGYGIDAHTALKIKQSHVTRCIISLDYYQQDIVSALRKNKLAFQDAVGAIKSLVKVGMYVTVTVCITELLLRSGELQKYLQFISGLGVSEVRIVMQIPQGNLEGKSVGKIYGEALELVHNFRKHYNEEENYPSIVNFCELESSDYFGCGAGANYIAVNSDGMVTPCVAVPLTFGNVNDKSLEEIFKEMEEYFPQSSKVCYGIASGRVIKNEEIDTSITPLPIDVSKKVAEKCIMATGQGKIFSACKECLKKEV